MCSLRSVVPSYLSMTKVFHPLGKGVSIISSIKGCLHAFFCNADVLIVRTVGGLGALSSTILMCAG